MVRLTDTARVLRSQDPRELEAELARTIPKFEAGLRCWLGDDQSREDLASLRQKGQAHVAIFGADELRALLLKEKLTFKEGDLSQARLKAITFPLDPIRVANPPVILIRCNDGYTIMNGNHRVWQTLDVRANTNNSHLPVLVFQSPAAFQSLVGYMPEPGRITLPTIDQVRQARDRVTGTLSSANASDIARLVVPHL